MAYNAFLATTIKAYFTWGGVVIFSIPQLRKLMYTVLSQTISSVSESLKKQFEPSRVSDGPSVETVLTKLRPFEKS